MELQNAKITKYQELRSIKTQTLLLLENDFASSYNVKVASYHPFFISWYSYHIPFYYF